MPFVAGKNRNQLGLGTLDTLVGPQSIARIIDAIVNSMDLKDLGFDRTQADLVGRPKYDAACLLKLYIYGNMEGIRSSRKLAHACRVNVEAMWLMQGRTPDFRTISDFRKDNADRLKGVFATFDKMVFEHVASGFMSVDGTKIPANCAMHKSFTKENIEESVKRLAARTAKYMQELDKDDEKEEKDKDALTRDELTEKLQKTQEKLERLIRYRDYMDQEGLSQLSITDADARLMKTKKGFAVAYNVQTAVDSQTHMVRNYEVTSACTDHGQLMPTLEPVREQNPDQILDATADKGYESRADITACLENGIVPNVIPTQGKREYELELPYEDAQITEEMRGSTNPENLSACLHAGVVPKAYEEQITEIRVEEIYRADEQAASETPVQDLPAMTPKEMQERAAQGFFVRDPESNTVICPAGRTLTQKSVRRNGKICYGNRAVCKDCPARDKCLTGKANHREIEFTKDQLERPHRTWQKAMNDGFAPKKPEKRRPLKKLKVVRFVFRPDRGKMDKRKELSEHPFGTIKRAMGANHFLLRGKTKTSGESALIFLGYNIRRALNLFGFNGMMKIMAG